MKLDIRDPLLLDSLSPTSVESYLRSGGWKPTHTDPGVAATWQFPMEHDIHEVRIPLDAESSGYAQRIRELLQELEAAERRSQLQVFMDIQSSNCDVVRVGSLARSDWEFPTLGNAITALEGTREILTSVASSVVEPQPWFSRRRPKEAVEYVASLEVGLFEDPAAIRVLSKLQTPLFRGHEDEFIPFPRRVGLMLREALSQLTELFEKADHSHSEVDLLSTCLTHGLSANVCEALCSLLQPQYGGSPAIEITLRLSPVRPFAGQALSKWLFRRSHLRALKGITEVLKALGTRLDDSLLFLITRIRATKRGGSVYGVALLEGDARPIHMNVDEELLRVANHAKSKNQAVKCHGRLRRRPDYRYEVLQPHDFQIIHTEDSTVETLRRKLPGAETAKEQLDLSLESP